MKKLAVIIVIALFIQSIASAQFGVSCLPDGITFSTQAEIDNFQTNYPNCTEIGGDVIISGGYIINLNGLSVVASIGGDLIIGGLDDGTYLINLTGLEALTYIGGDLRVFGNFALTSLTGLDNLSFIHGNFYLGVRGLYFEGGNPLLTSLIGLGSLTSVGGYLSISSNNGLTSLSGLDNIDSIPDLYIRYNNSLASCETQWLCDYLADPNGSINIYSNAPGCNNPIEIADSCGITLSCLPFGNYYFFTQSDIDNFQTNYPNCTEIEGDIYISGDSSISDLNGLSVLTSIGRDLAIGKGGELYFGINNNLSSLEGLNNLTSIGRDLVIGYSGPGPGSGGANPILANLTGLEGLTSIGRDLNIESNESLTNLSGLDNLNSLGGELMIENNYSLTSLTGLNNLDSIWGDILIHHNVNLLNLTGLENLTYIDGGLYIGSSTYINSSLTSLTGLEGLTSIGKHLKISDNSSLTSLTSLYNLTSIGAGLTIQHNTSLTSLEGLDNIDAATIDSLRIIENQYLSICEVQSICDFLKSPNGEIVIWNNAWHCDSQSQVEDRCEIVSVDEIHLSDKLIIYPNPSSSQITIELPNTPQKDALLIIYNMKGQQMLTNKITEQKTMVDISGLPKGIYFIEVADDRMLMVGKMVKK